MRSYTLLAGFFVLLAASCALESGDPAAQSLGKGNGGWQGAEPFATTCAPGTFDCDGNDTCECEPAGPCSTAACNGTSCAQTAKPAGTFCSSPPASCTGTGACGAAGTCECDTGNTGPTLRPDMSMGGGTPVGGCSVAQTGTSDALAPLLLALALLGLSRLRSRRRA